MIVKKVWNYMHFHLRSAHWKFEIPSPCYKPNATHVDLGAGLTPRNPFQCQELIALDFYPENKNMSGTEYVNHNILTGLPFLDDSIDSISAYDFLEHIPRLISSNDKNSYPFIDLMNEVSRCLKPGGIFLAATPAFPRKEAFQDPTHVNFITNKTVKYFTNQNLISDLSYGISNRFELVAQTWIFAGSGFRKIDENRKFGDFRNNSNGIWILKLIHKILSYVFQRFYSRPTHLLWVLRKIG